MLVSARVERNERSEASSKDKNKGEKERDATISEMSELARAFNPAGTL